MKSSPKVLLGVGLGLLTLWIGWGTYVTKTTERVPFERKERFDGVEVRRYPRTVFVETTASTSGTAFRRLFRYINGANAANLEVSMTAPVETRGEAIAMTTPVRTDRTESSVTMAFFLPSQYTQDTAPRPTDETVTLGVEPARRVAVRTFSWYATARRVDRQRRRLLETLDSHDMDVCGEPTLFQYNDPWTPPFMRRNEVAVRLDHEKSKL